MIEPARGIVIQWTVHVDWSYNRTMRTKLIPMGNSKGVRLPKGLVEQYNFAAGIELEPAVDHLILRPVYSPRQGWDEAFNRMHRTKDDLLLDADETSVPSKWDRSEWKW